MIIDRIMAIRDESRSLKTVLYARILLLKCYRRHVSHVTNICILKILNLKQNVDCSLVKVSEKPFQDPKLISKSPELIDQKYSYYILYRCLFKKQGLNQHILDRATFSGLFGIFIAVFLNLAWLAISDSSVFKTLVHLVN